MSRSLSVEGPLKAVALVLTLLLLLGTPPAASAQTSYRPGFPSDALLEQMLGYLVEDGETPGIILGILDVDGSTRVVSRGSAGPNARPLGRQTMFELGSINKTFTGTRLARLELEWSALLGTPRPDTR